MVRTTTPTQIRAAGCIVWRFTRKGNIKVLLIHRPVYGDWSFPKGKVKPGEDELACALREVFEEASATGMVGQELTASLYVDQRGRTKSVRYWTMHYESGVFEANDEVDQIKWVKVSKAAKLLTYERDVALLAEFTEVV